MCALVDLNNEILACKVQLQLVSDEEQDGENCSKYLTKQGYLGDFVVCGEPTNLGIGVQAKGILQIDIEIFGKSAHGSRPWQGENAIIKAYEIFNLITKLPFAKEKSEFYEFPSINLSKIEGGNIYNKVPDYCKMSLDIRFLPHQKIDEILIQIKSVAGDKVIIYSEGDPVKTDINDPYVKKLIGSISSVSKQGSVSTFGQHGSADTRFFSVFNIPAVEFGPCGENWHGDDEYVTFKSVELYKEILVQFAKDFA
jgi:succinyl-diaminopimelate desuccinylase